MQTSGREQGSLLVGFALGVWGAGGERRKNGKLWLLGLGGVLVGCGLCVGWVPSPFETKQSQSRSQTNIQEKNIC